LANSDGCQFVIPEFPYLHPLSYIFHYNQYLRHAAANFYYKFYYTCFLNGWTGGQMRERSHWTGTGLYIFLWRREWGSAVRDGFLRT
jgi:hypothetical protein